MAQVELRPRWQIGQKRMDRVSEPTKAGGLD
jgi:hypothetical protein